MVLDRIENEISESYTDLKESVSNTYDAVVGGDTDLVDFDRRKAIVSAGSLIAGWEGLKRVPNGTKWAAGQSPYEVNINRRDEEKARAPEEELDEEPVFDGRTVSEMLESEGQLTRNAFSDYICEINNESNIEEYSLENAYSNGNVELDIRGDTVSIRGSQPGFSASKEFEDYFVERHKRGTLDNQLLDYWGSECQ